MKRICLISFICLFIGVCLSYAQDSEFKILTSNGKIFYQEKGGKKWLEIKSGMKLTSNAKLRLNRSSYIALVYSNGQTLEFQKAGTYELKKFEAQVKNSNANISKQFINYIVNEMQDIDSIFGESNYNLKTTGGVARKPYTVTDKLSKENKTIYRDYYAKLNVLDNNFTVKWNCFEEQKTYRIVIYDELKNEIYDEIVNDTTFNIDLSKIKTRKDAIYYWNVGIADNETIKSEMSSFVVLGDSKVSKINDTLKQLKSELKNEDSPLTQIIFAKYYERNDLLIEAEKCYKKAIELAPYAEKYVIMYESFINKKY